MQPNEGKQQPIFHVVEAGRVPQVWAQLRLDARWRAAYRIVFAHGVPVIGEIRVLPWEPDAPVGQWSATTYGVIAQAPPGGVKAKLVRQLPIIALGRGLKKLHAALWAMQDLPTPMGKQMRQTLPAIAALKTPELFKKKSPRGRKGKPDRFYLQIARTYAEECLKAKPHPLLAVQKKHKLTLEQARAAVYRARHQKAYLSDAKPGRAHGELTARAQAALRRH